MTDSRQPARKLEPIAFDCHRCGRRIGARATHYVVAGPKVICSRCVFDYPQTLGSGNRAGIIARFPLLAHQEPNGAGRAVLISWADDTEPQRVRWTWEGRIARGSLVLLAGREDLGKSTVALTLGGDLTRGQLPGEHFGTPRVVLVATSEDSWAHVVVPRLMAARANLGMVARIEVRADEHLEELSFPDDIESLERIITEADPESRPALLILDPLISRLSSNLDTHRDAEVRQALEPLVKLAERTGLAIIGIIHHNKSASGKTDPLEAVMASKAFPAVARSVLTIVRDPDDESRRRRYFGIAKNNLGRSDLPSLAFTIEGYTYDTHDGPGETGRVVWAGETVESVWDVMGRADQTPAQRTKETDAIEWLESYMASHDGKVPAKQGVADGKAGGYSKSTLDNARRRAGIETRKAAAFGGAWFWIAPVGVVPEDV